MKLTPRVSLIERMQPSDIERRDRVHKKGQWDPASLEPDDVILGRGFRFAWHSGNNRFQDLVNEIIPRYDAATRKCEKSRLIQLVFDQVTTKGRFLKKDETTELYYKVDEHTAKEKISQAIRYKKRLKRRAGDPENEESKDPYTTDPYTTESAAQPSLKSLLRHSMGTTSEDIFDDLTLESVLGPVGGRIQWPSDPSELEDPFEDPGGDSSSASLFLPHLRGLFRPKKRR